MYILGLTQTKWIKEGDQQHAKGIIDEDILFIWKVRKEFLEECVRKYHGLIKCRVKVKLKQKLHGGSR